MTRINTVWGMRTMSIVQSKSTITKIWVRVWVYQYTMWSKKLPASNFSICWVGLQGHWFGQRVESRPSNGLVRRRMDCWPLKGLLSVYMCNVGQADSREYLHICYWNGTRQNSRHSFKWEEVARLVGDKYSGMPILGIEANIAVFRYICVVHSVQTAILVQVLEEMEAKVAIFLEFILPLSTLLFFSSFFGAFKMQLEKKFALSSWYSTWTVEQIISIIVIIMSRVPEVVCHEANGFTAADATHFV